MIIIILISTIKSSSSTSVRSKNRDNTWERVRVYAYTIKYYNIVFTRIKSRKRGEDDVYILYFKERAKERERESVREIRRRRRRRRRNESLT